MFNFKVHQQISEEGRWIQQPKYEYNYQEEHFGPHTKPILIVEYEW